MRLALPLAISTAALLAAGLAASAHDAAGKIAGPPPPHCPMVRPAPTPKPACPTGRRVAHHERRGHHGREFARTEHRWGDHRWADRRGGDDYVSASQAFVYRREMERDRGDFAGERFAGRGREMGRPEFDRHGMEGRAFSSSHSYALESRQSESGGSVRGERDGHRFGWSWGAHAGGCCMKGQEGGDRDWRHGQGAREVYDYAGRDENGWLVWPGKTRSPE